MSVKINLTEAEKEVIQKYFKGEITTFGTSDEDMQTMKGVINKAEDLMHELEAYEDAQEDMIKWYWDLHEAQNQ